MKQDICRISFPGSYSYAGTECNRFDSGTRTKAVVIPDTGTTPTVGELLSMFEEDTQVDIDPLCGVLSDEDILDETYVVNENELLTMSDEVTQVTPATVELKVYYYVCPPATDTDLVPDFAWQMTTYLFGTTEQYVCNRVIDGFQVQVWRTSDGFIAQPIQE